MSSRQAPSTLPRRCAIYARKSSQHGLEQDFNSLEAQKELCSAYILSQQHRGWTQIDRTYVDAAQSGGSLDRPALQRLLSDIEADLVDIVVIYKLDRLSRSLLDFVRLMAVLDRNSVSFVCITQNFDTGDSLGRLIMNVLLTFAQFERELTGDRIRDKRRVMASNGIWIGSHPPFGYDYVDKQLVPNECEAPAVRWMYERYNRCGSIGAVWRECASRGLLSKVRTSKDGEVTGGQPMHRASLRSILCNPVYMGDVTHLGSRYRGRHKPIVSKQLWEAVQRLRLETTARRNDEAPTDRLPSVIFDCYGRRMAMVRKYRNGGCERHYQSYPTAWGKLHRVPRMRAPAEELEKLTIAAISSMLLDREQMRSILLRGGRRECHLEMLSGGCEIASRRVSDASVPQQVAILHALIARLELSRVSLTAVLRVSELERFLTWDGLDFFSVAKPIKHRKERTHLLEVPAIAVRLSRKFRLPIEPRASDWQARPDRKLITLLQQVRRAQQLVDTQRTEPIAELAKRMSRGTGHFMKLLRLNYLAPDIVASILDGTQPDGLTRRELLDANLPMDWSIQRKLFRFPEQPPMQTSERY